MKSVALLAHTDLDEVFAYRPQGTATVREFLATAAALAEQMPPGRQFLNLCEDRYHFAVGLAAGLLSERTSLQPASQSAETLRQIRSEYADVFCLCDGRFETIDLPRLDFPAFSQLAAHGIQRIPEVDGERRAMRVYTSGSTGLPVPHDKPWGSLVRSAHVEARRLGLLDGEAPHSIVGTVPAQHMYGVESTILLAMHGNARFWSSKPFYPQDIATALALVPPPRLLVSTPFHLSALLAADVVVPPIAMILSATAPLSDELAARVESRLLAPLFEIYGCTEAGQLASRRSLDGAAWLPLEGVCLQRQDGMTIACGGHIQGRIILADHLELSADGRFALLGRNADLIGIAGKRSSLAYLNHQILAVPGVVDAAYFQPGNDPGDGLVRLCAFAVAPELTEQELLAALRQRVDAVFLPRPLFLVDALPRNATGKLPRAALQALYETQREARDASHRV